ncbi:hypothetical protein NA78x_003965 [Anatilimnocola sp. NA78]|uniref:hypothetical protein n=1 Tax=Anatilimnocola sp. NA78 TaxID=3415683 RepID=UPI003CE58D71
MKCIAGAIIILAGAILASAAMLAASQSKDVYGIEIALGLGAATMFLGLVIFVAYRQDPN